eukprot:scaffold463338_cov21-Prasinocladus_malaysianus.AAC.1
MMSPWNPRFPRLATASRYTRTRTKTELRLGTNRTIDPICQHTVARSAYDTFPGNRKSGKPILSYKTGHRLGSPS